MSNFHFYPRFTLRVSSSSACSAQSVPCRKLSKHRSDASYASDARRWRYLPDLDGVAPAYKLNQGESTRRTRNLDRYRRRYNRAARRAAKLFLSTYSPEA